MKSLLVFGFLAAALVGCGVDNKASLQDITIGTEKLENSWDKAVSDTRNEYDRTENRVDETLVKANEDVVNEEHAVTGRTKDTLAKANADVLDEEATTTGRVKDTLAQSNADAVEEEHKFNDRFKTTSKKTNMDAVAEGDKLTDRLVGSDDKTVDDHGDRIRELERRMALVEQTNALQDALLQIHSTHFLEADASLKDLSSQLASEVGRLEVRISTAQSGVDTLSVLLTDLTLRTDELASRLTAAEGSIGALQYDLGQEITARMDGDSDILAALAHEATVRAAGDIFLGASIIAESFTRAIRDNQLSTALGAETAARILRDSQLTTAIANEVTTRSAADAANAAAIAAEAVTRAAGDAALTTAQNTLASRVTTLETAVNSACTLTVGPKSSTVAACNDTDGDECDDWDSLKKATVTLQCLGKPAQVIHDVLFRN